MVPRQPKDNSTRGPSEVKSVEAIDSPYHADIIQPLTFTWWGSRCQGSQKITRGFVYAWEGKIAPNERG